MKSRLRPRDLAALLLGLLLILVAAGAVYSVFCGLVTAALHIAAPVILIALAVLALVGLRR